MCGWEACRWFNKCLGEAMPKVWVDKAKLVVVVVETEEKPRLSLPRNGVQDSKLKQNDRDYLVYFQRVREPKASQPNMIIYIFRTPYVSPDSRHDMHA